MDLLLNCLKCPGETQHTTEDHIDNTIDNGMEMTERSDNREDSLGGYYDGY